MIDPDQLAEDERAREALSAMAALARAADLSTIISELERARTNPEETA